MFGQSDIVTNGWHTDADLKKPYTVGEADADLDLYTSYYTAGLELNGSTVTAYYGTATEIVIPSRNGNRKVTTIGDDVFNRSTELPAITSVKLPKTVTMIGDGAFYNCQYLSEINITSNVASIGKNAFYRNVRLRYVGDLSGLGSTGLGEGAFNGCRDLREITLNNSIMEIGDYTFNDCAMLKTITLPNGLKSIGKYAFSGCTSLKTVKAESNILGSIGEYAFKDCTALTDVTITRTTAVDLGEGVFDNCRKVTVYVPDSVLDTYKDNKANEQFKDKFAAIR